MYNLYYYMFRHFRTIIREYYTCALLSYQSFQIAAVLYCFIRSRCFASSYISSWVTAVEITVL